MRTQFTSSLMELMAKNSNVMLLTIDLGYSFFEPLQVKYPKQYINTGCIEQSAIGIAGGLAMGGKIPFVFSCSTFLIMRPYEFIRNDICEQKMNVKLVGYAGKNYNFLGYSHLPRNKEDIKILKLLKNIKIYEPKNKGEVKKAIQAEAKRKGPAYIRLV